MFVLDYDIKKCARYHCDKHVVKMILESAQMLSAAVRLNGVNQGYAITHKNHSCSKWARESISNWKWLRKLASELNREYKFRFERQTNHKSYDLIQRLVVPNVKDKGLTSFVLAMPDKYKNNDPIVSYRSYYLGEKTKLFKWTSSTFPTKFSHGKCHVQK